MALPFGSRYRLRATGAHDHPDVTVFGVGDTEVKQTFE